MDRLYIARGIFVIGEWSTYEKIRLGQERSTAGFGDDLLVRQRTATINSIRGHLAEFDFVVPKAPIHIRRLQDIIKDGASGPPDQAQAL